MPHVQTPRTTVLDQLDALDHLVDEAGQLVVVAQRVAVVPGRTTTGQVSAMAGDPIARTGQPL
jgi:hypothetical protein